MNYSLPLLPLNQIVFPEGILSFEVSESHYLDMMRNCLRHNNHFGVISFSGRDAQSNPLAFTRTGTSFRLLNVDFTRPGMMTIRAIGQHRFHIRAVARQNGFWLAQAVNIANDLQIPVPDEFKNIALALQQKIDLIKQSGLQQYAMPFMLPCRMNDCGWVANRLSELLDFSLQKKQQLLETDSPLIRLGLLQDYILADSSAMV